VLVTVINTSDSQLLKRRGLFWLTVLEVSVHESLTLNFGPVARQHNIAEVHGRAKPLTSWPGSKEFQSPSRTYQFSRDHLGFTS
jgi:hypothetical protein